MTTPANFIAALGAIAALPWMPLDRTDRAMFADAGPDARICDDVPLPAQRIICEALGLPTFAWGMLAIIGGEGLQVEFHGQDADGAPIAYALPLALIQH